MGVYLTCTVLFPNEQGEYSVDEDWEVDEGPLTRPSSNRAALLCARYSERLNFKECNGPHPATLNPGGQLARWHDERGSTQTTIWGRCNITWYHITELHELMNTVPGALEILGEAFIGEVYRILQENPKAIIQFACDQ